MFNRKTLLIAVAGVVALVALVLMIIIVNQPAPVVAANQPPSVAAAPANEPPVVPAPTTIQVLGTIASPNQASVTFKGGGRITELRVQEGATVKRGDTLALLDTTELQLAVQQAQGALDVATANFNHVKAGPTPDDIAVAKSALDRAKAAVDQAQAAYDRIGGASNPQIAMTPQSLALQQAYSQLQAATGTYNQTVNHPTATELETAQGQVVQAQAALALAQQQLANATLTAPFDGTVIWLGPHVGETVAPTTAIATLADLSHLQLQGSVDQVLLGQIQVGQTATIIPDAFKDKTVTGKVSRIGWLATSTAGATSLPVTIDVDPSDIPLRPGLSATAQIQIPSQ